MNSISCRLTRKVRMMEYVKEESVMKYNSVHHSTLTQSHTIISQKTNRQESSLEHVNVKKVQIVIPESNGIKSEMKENIVPDAAKVENDDFVMPEEVVESYAPWNFSWVIPDKLAAMAFPRNKEHLNYLVEVGIKHLITFCSEKQPPMSENGELKWTDIPIEQFEMPSLEQICQFMDICDKAEREKEVIGIHCRMGRSRCGVIIACYLVRFHNMNKDQAIEVVQTLRPGSCDEPEHENAVKQYYEYLNKKGLIKGEATQAEIDRLIKMANDKNEIDLESHQGISDSNKYFSIGDLSEAFETICSDKIFVSIWFMFIITFLQPPF